MSSSADKRRCKLVHIVMDPLCTPEERVLLHTTGVQSRSETDMNKTAKDCARATLKDHLDKVTKARLLAAFREHNVKLPSALQPANQTALEPTSVETQLQNISNVLNERAGFTQLPSKDERKWSIDKVIASTQALLQTTGKHFWEHYDSTHATSAAPSRGADATNNKT